MPSVIEEGLPAHGNNHIKPHNGLNVSTAKVVVLPVGFVCSELLPLYSFADRVLELQNGGFHEQIFLPSHKKIAILLFDV